MKRSGFLMFLLLVATWAGYSQTFRMDVSDKPLSKVLNMLDLEISFDDRALSAYSVSVSRIFENQEKALSWLLEDKPFRIEKTGNVFVIVPRNSQQQEEVYVTFQEAEKERFIFRGTVVSQATGEWLEYAIVSFLDGDDQPLISGITTNTGQFVIQTSRIPVKIKISYLGHETLLQTIHNLKGDLGYFPLTEKPVQLGEAVVTTNHTKPAVNHTTYVITPQMQDGIDNSLELLNKIPGAYFDKSSNTILLNNQTNILLMADGIQYPLAYFSHLSPRRIQTIDVIYSQSGRFVSDDYAGIINFILKKDYTGYDIYVSNATSLNLSKTAGENCLLSKNHPSVGFIFTTRKLNFFGAYEYDHEKSNLYSSKSLAYNVYELASNPADHPNNLTQFENHTVNGGVNYHITTTQLVGLQADYTSGNTASFQEYTMQRTDLSNSNNRILTNTTENRIKAHTFTGTLFYRGQVANRLHLYGDFSYNYYYNDMENEYRQDKSSNYHYADFWDEFKNQTVFNLDGKYLLSNRMSLEAGYSNIRRQYASESSQGRGFLDYSEDRNKAFVYFSCYLSDKTGLRFGIAPEFIRQRNSETKTHYLRVLPYLHINHKFNQRASLSTGYATNQAYPSLYQLSPMSIVVDTFLTQIGNPMLLSAVRHQVFAELSLWNKLKITPQFNYITDGTSEVYTRKEYKLYRTFDNVNFREYSLNISYDQAFGAYFRLKNSVMLYHSEALHEGVCSSVNGWTLHSEGDYYHPASSFGVQLGYYRHMKKNILWQGYQMSDRDYWCITARKELWKDRISVMLSYIPPLAFGVRYDRMKEIDTPLYKEKTTQNFESYNQMLLLKVNFRFERGGHKPPENRRINRNNERER